MVRRVSALPLAAACLALFVCLAPAPALCGATLREMAGQMIMTGFRGETIDDSAPIARDIAAGRVGGVVLFSRDVLLGEPRNIIAPAQVRKLSADLQRRSRIPLFVAIDQEGGRVQRMSSKNGFMDFPSARSLGLAGDVVKIRSTAAFMGLTLAGAGFNLDFAPVVDVDVNPASPAIGALERSFSPDPEKVALFAGAFAQGLRSGRVFSCLKHFPGHGSAASDSHQGYTDVTRTWSETELAPYRRLIAQGLADMVMTSHVFNANLDPQRPASLSKAVTTGLLREKLGFQGVVITDDLQMKAVTSDYSLEQAVFMALDAGADILLFGNNLAYDPDVASKVVDIIETLVVRGRIDEDRLRHSYARIMALKKRLPR